MIRPDTGWRDANDRPCEANGTPYSVPAHCGACLSHVHHTAPMPGCHACNVPEWVRRAQAADLPPRVTGGVAK